MPEPDQASRTLWVRRNNGLPGPSGNPSGEDMTENRIPCGIEIPQVFIDAPVDPDHVKRFVARAEELGYDSLWTQERILSPFSMLEPVTLMTYAAAVTSRLKIGSSVLLTVLRNPLQLAKSLASLDQLSRGRVIVGVGLGGVRGRQWPEDETVFGYSPEGRVTRFVEGIQVMKALWRDERTSFRGRFWDFTDVAMEPKPAQQPLPLWFGGHAEPALRRAVALGDGWMGAGSSDTQRFVKEYDRIVRLLDQADRDPATFAVSKRVYLAVDHHRDRAERRLREFFAVRYQNADLGARVCIWGGRQEVIDRLNELVRSGARHLLLNPAFDEMEHLEILAEDVAPHLG